VPAATGAEPVSLRDELAGPRDALAEGAWQRSLDQLDALGPAARSAAALELRAQAAYGNGELERSVQAWEDLHALALQVGDHAEAARAAAMIAMYLMMDTGLMAPVRGWLRRAERLLTGHEESPAHALVAMVCTYERFMCGDMDAARQHASRAIELGDRLHVQPAVVIGRVASARLEIYAGHVQRGLDLLDEVGVLLMSGEVDPLTTGMMYCELICAAQGLGRFDLAREWTEVMEQWRHGAAFGGINGRCRVHRAELLRISGPCDRAEQEALGACDELRPWMRREFGWPLVELGNIRLRKGDLAGAEEAFLAAHAHAWSPQPGLALLRLAEGDVEAATALITDAIAHPVDIPSKERPPFGDLRVAPLLDAQAEIAAAAGDAATARRAAEGLASIADVYGSDALRAAAALARARAATVEGSLDEAVDAAGTAVVVWSALGAPFEAAVARVVLGDAHHRADRAGQAALEWNAARSAFATFGAGGWCANVDQRLTGTPPASQGPVPAPAGAAFRCEGDTRSITFGGRTVLVRDLKGLRLLARLLAEPGREFHVLDLVAGEHGALPVDRPGLPDVEGLAGAGLPVLDQQARDAYRRRLAEVDEDIEEAASMNDVGRLELAQRDRDYLIAELTQAVGLGGRHRAVGSTAERARTSVTRSIRYAIARVAEHHPTLGAHLGQAVRTGTYCCYAPDPLAAVSWEVTPLSMRRTG
jgi:tetratricopeptide (TPR) repeat protein